MAEKVVIMIPQEYKQEAEELMNFLETLKGDERKRLLDWINGAKTMKNIMTENMKKQPA